MNERDKILLRYVCDGDMRRARQQAKLILENAKYTDIRVHRMKELDHLYQGKTEINWYDDETRLLLVRDFGWACVETS